MQDYSEYEEEGFWTSIPLNVFHFFETYGWYLLIALIFLLVIYAKVLKSYIQRFKEYRFEREYAAKYHKNPDVFAAHINAQQQWAQKMQEKYNKEMEEQLKKMKEREEKKRQEFAEKYGNTCGVVGHTLDTSSKKNENNLRPDYNPLMGPGGSSTYRPPRRSPCGGGGCGR